jgi:hypothetical protein
MPIPSTIESLSTTAASNGPSGSDQRNIADDGLRTAYAFIKMGVVQGSDIVSASTITPPSTGWLFDVTGTTAVTAMGSTNSWDGRMVALQFDGILTFTHSSNLTLPGSANITTAAGDVAFMIQRGSGAWRCVNYQRANGSLVNSGVSITSGKTLSVSNSLTLAGTDSTTITFPGVSTAFNWGTYTPTLNNGTNVAASTANAEVSYIRVGNIVTVAGTVKIDPTSVSTTTILEMSLPIASDLSANQLSGTANRANSTLPALSSPVLGNATSDRARIVFQNDSEVDNEDWAFIYQYKVV